MQTGLFKKRMVVMLLMLSMNMFFMGCESGGGGGDDDPEPTPTPEAETSSVSWDQSKIDGHWEGYAGTAQAPAEMPLSSEDNSVSGSLAWPGGDIRSISGYVFDGNSAILYVTGGDTWSVSWRGNSLSGTGTKPDGNTYPVTFSR